MNWCSKSKFITWSLTLKLLLFRLLHLGEIRKYMVVVCFYHVAQPLKISSCAMSLFFNHLSYITFCIMTLLNSWVPILYFLSCEERKAGLFWLPINNKVWGSITDGEYLVVQSEEGWAKIWLVGGLSQDMTVLDTQTEYLCERHISNVIFPTSFSGCENAESET